MKFNLNSILTIFGAIQTVVEVVKATVKVVKKKAPEPKVTETEDAEAKDVSVS